MWVVESVWVGCFGGVGMCTVVGSSLNWCRLVVLVLNFSMVERWVSGFVWLVVCFGFSSWNFGCRLLWFIGGGYVDLTE